MSFFMKRFSPQKSQVSQYTTEMMRVVISGGKKPSSPWERLFSLLWLPGALVVIIVYIVIPTLIALHQIPTMLFELLVATIILFLAELIVSAILLKIASPAPAPSVTPRRHQSKPHSLATPPPVQAMLPLTPGLNGSRASQFVMLRSLQPSRSSSQSVADETGASAPVVLPQRLKLPAR